MGVSIVGGARSKPGNPDDKTDEGVFISKVHVRARARVSRSSVSTCTAAVPVNIVWFRVALSEYARKLSVPNFTA